MKKNSSKVSDWVPSHPLDQPPDPGPEEDTDSFFETSEDGDLHVDPMHQDAVNTIKDIVPTLDMKSIIELMKANDNDLERAVDAALALSTALSNEVEGNKQEPETKTTNTSDIITTNNNTSQTMAEFQQDVAYRKLLVRQLGILPATVPSKHRGSRMKLPSTFLSCPRFRLIWNRVAESFVEFSVVFCKRDRKLGMTLQESNTEIVVLSMQDAGPGNPCLAAEAGVMEGDVIMGINGEMFSPWAELQDVIELLNKSGAVVTIHFHRRLRAERLNIMKLHPSIPHFIEQNVISNDKARVIDKLLTSFKRRILNWDDNRFAEKIENIKSNMMEAEAAMLAPPPDRRMLRRSVSGIPTETPKPSLPQRPVSMRRKGSISNATDLHDISDAFGPWLELKHVRPALAVRILKTEVGKTGDYTVYLIWIFDVKSGKDWVVRRRFREFFEFREVRSLFIDFFSNMPSII